MIIVIRVPDDTYVDPNTGTGTGGQHYDIDIGSGQRLSFFLIGVDGSTWNLYDGPVYAMPGTSGWGAPAPEHWWRTSPVLSGSTWHGSRVPQRDMSLPIHIEAATSLEWRDTEDAWFAAIGDGTKECHWVVATPDARVRSLPVRYTGGGDLEYERDPLLAIGASYALTFTAGDPYWQGEAVTETFNVGALPSFFAVSGGVVNIGTARSVTSATVTNPGDIDSWPRWVINGPFTGFTVGVGANLVTYSGTVAAGAAVTVETDPRAPSISRTVAGTDPWLNITAASFAPIPPGADVDLSTVIVGGTDGVTGIDVSFTPRHRKAW